MEPYETIINRRSVRQFRPEPVSRELLTKIIDAARLAPSARNEQPWEFVVITDPDRIRRLAALGDNARPLTRATACIVVLCRPSNFYLEDGSAATTQLMIAASALGIGTCWIAGDKKPYAAEALLICGAPPEYKLVSMIAVGYPAETPLANKRPLDSVLHWEKLS